MIRLNLNAEGAKHEKIIWRFSAWACSLQKRGRELALLPDATASPLSAALPARMCYLPHAACSMQFAPRVAAYSIRAYHCCIERFTKRRAKSYVHGAPPAPPKPPTPRRRASLATFHHQHPVQAYITVYRRLLLHVPDYDPLGAPGRVLSVEGLIRGGHQDDHRCDSYERLMSLRLFI